MHTQLISNILLIQIFWFSFGFIGYAGFLFMQKKLGSYSRLDGLTHFFRHSNALVKVLLSFVLGMIVFVPWLVIGTYFHLPVAVLAIFYVITLCIALGTYFYYFNDIKKAARVLFTKKPKKFSVLAFSVITLVLLFDYGLSLKIGPPLFGDAIVHTAKIQQLSVGHFTLEDPIFGNGVIESRYHINLPLSLHALAVQVLRIDTINVWVYSLAFWRLMMYLALFSLTWIFLENSKSRSRWSYSLLAIMPLFYSATFLFADYPGRIVYIWTVIMLAGLKLFLEKRDGLLLVVGASLIATTHPITSLMAGAFVALLGGVLLLLRRLTRAQIYIFALVGIILTAPVVLSNVFPDRMSPTAFGLEPVVIRRHGPILLGLPLKISSAWEVWLVTLLSMVGYIYLIHISRRRAQKLLIGLLVIFYSLLVYNPVFLEIIHGRMPAWVLHRFQELNVFGLVAPFIGLLLLVENLVRKRRYFKSLSPTTICASMVVVIAAYSLLYLRTAQSFASFHIEYTRNYNGMMLLKQFRPELEGQKAFADNTFTQPWLPATTGANIVNINETQASPMSNILMRIPCAIRLRETMELHDLRAIGVTRVVANVDIDPHLADLSERSSALKFVRQLGPNRLYEVRQDVQPTQPVATSLCSIPYGQ